MPPVKRLAQNEMEAHHVKGLCYNCYKKFVLSHCCKMQQLFFLDMECEDDELAYIVLVEGPKV